MHVDVYKRQAGAYQDYYLDVKMAGLYDVKVNYSHDCGGDTKAVIMTVDGKITATLGEVTLKNSGGWSNWKDSDTIQIKLEAGKQFIRIYDDLDGFNYRNFQLTFKGEQDVTAPEITGKMCIRDRIWIISWLLVVLVMTLVNNVVVGQLLGKGQLEIQHLVQLFSVV